MSLIDKLRDCGESLFSSKKAFVAHQAMPDDSSVTTISQSGQDVTDYIAPFDGYAVLTANATNSGSIGLGLYSGSKNYGAVLTAPVDAGQTNSLIKPVAKGNSVRYYTYRNNLKDITLKFVRSIGGINRLCAQAVRCVRGGVLWLTSSTYSGIASILFSQLRKSGSTSKFVRRAFTLKAPQLTKTADMLKSLRQLPGTRWFRSKDQRADTYVCVSVVTVLTIRLLSSRLVSPISMYLVKKDRLSVICRVLARTERLRLWRLSQVIDCFAKEVCHA